MGDFSDKLLQRIRAQRAVKRVRWPKDFVGGVMFCPLCAGEVLRMPVGHSATIRAQQAAVDAHAAVCARAKFASV